MSLAILKITMAVRPGLLARIAGALADFGVQVVQVGMAQIERNRCVVSFHVECQPDSDVCDALTYVRGFSFVHNVEFIRCRPEGQCTVLAFTRPKYLENEP